VDLLETDKEVMRCENAQLLRSIVEEPVKAMKRLGYSNSQETLEL
jgi:hypothetical protein